MWECIGGSAVKGEDSLLGAIRDAKEEVGVDLTPENGKVLFTKTRKIFNDIMDSWLFDYDGEVDLGNATTDEVEQDTWMNREQINWNTSLRKWISSNLESWWIYEGKRTSIHRVEGIMAG